jgi:hypothetical protein
MQKLINNRNIKDQMLKAYPAGVKVYRTYCLRRLLFIYKLS